MNVRIAESALVLSPQQRASVEEKLKLALSRFGQLFEYIYVSFAAIDDSFDANQVSCYIELELQSGEMLKVEVTSTTTEEALENATHRIKRNLERQRKLRFNRNNYQNHGVIEK
jgi:ribosome-associated translation inhibitor RaiA